MNAADPAQIRYALVREILELPDYVRGLDLKRITSFADRVRVNAVLLSGEGSSRIFPAKKVLADAWRHGYRDRLHAEAATKSVVEKALFRRERFGAHDGHFRREKGPSRSGGTTGFQNRADIKSVTAGEAGLSLPRDPI